MARAGAKKGTKALAKVFKLGPGEKLGPKYKKKVPCSLGLDDRTTKSERIVEALGETKHEREAMREATSGHRKIINELIREVENLREQLAAGSEEREVYVAERMNYREDKVEIYRVDTNEMVEERKMEPSERQEQLPKVPRARRGAKASEEHEDASASDEVAGET